MRKVYLALKRSVGIVLLLFCQSAFAQPVISSFSPESAWPGLTVTITGSGFSPVKDSNIVYFGPVRATVQSASATTLNVTVPIGATCAPVTVTVNRLTTYSRLAFNVRFQNWNITLDTTAFGSKKDFYGFSNNRSITLADFNRDGRADLFVTNQGNNTVAVLRNTSVPQTVSFAPVKNFTGGPGAFGSAAGDFDGDGRLDVAVANANNGLFGSVSVFRNSSIGDTIRFDTTRYATGNGTVRVAVADIDRDGKPDLLAVSSNSGIISVFRNTTTFIGAITFAPKIDITTGFGPGDLAVADIDGDGKPDLISIYAGTNSGVSIWRNLSTPGSISFASRVNFPTVINPSLVKIGDLNEDGKPDIVVANYGSANLSTFRNRSTAGNIVLDPKQDYATGVHPQSISIADLNGDSRLDVAVGCDTPRAICVYPGGYANFDSIKLGARVEFKTGSGLSDIAIGDIDGDGEVDLAFCNYFNGYAVSVLRNLQNGEFPVITSFTPTSAGKGTFVTIYGKYLATTSAVMFGDAWTDSVRVLSDSVVEARVNNGATGDVKLFTHYGIATKPGFTYISDTTNIPDTTAPAIISFSPTSAQRGTPVYIFGSRFTGTTDVRFGGINADSIFVLSDSLIKAIVDTGSTGSVSVTTPYGTASKPGFTFIADTTNPDTTVYAIYNFTPKSAQAGAVITIFGSGFTGVNAAIIGNAFADSVVVMSDTVVQARVAANATSGEVGVWGPKGYRNIPGFIFIPDTTTPSILNFWPTSGTKGTAVNILGKNIRNATTVSFGGVMADSIVFLNDTTIRAIVDTGATGNVTVYTPYGTASKPGFTYISDTTINDSLFVSARKNTSNGTTPNSFVLYPNPASKYVIWQQPVIDHRTRLKLVDISGRVLKQFVVNSNTPQTTIQLNGLQAGVYKLVYIDGKNKLSRTLLIK